MDQERTRRVARLFHSALGLEAAARQGFLDVACGGDIDLQRQVELLLAREEKAGSFLETPAARYATVTQPITVPLLGRQFGPYRIVCPLGSGGMGEVYRAHDSKLGRDVAIKILPPEFARDPERLARFRREARTLASLNHPNIAAIYGLEESGEVDCLVLELVEGETLHGPLPIERALDYARQVADGLEAAHQQGIIHRDLKPANVKVTRQGRVKVLDFGLAKAVWGPVGNQNLSQQPALKPDETLEGHILGTPGYMSPEQTNGRPVDERTDIWAFGCLLYELLTGKRAFHGESQQDSIAAVLEREPDWQDLPAGTPPKIAELLRHCLQKEPGRRLANISDARRTIEAVRRGQNPWPAVAIAAGVLATAAVGAVLFVRSPVRPSDQSQWVQLTKFADSVTQPVLSPDGRMVAFIRGPSTFLGPGQVYVKILPDGEPRQLTHDGNIKLMPAFSNDGTHIAYTTYMNQDFSWDTWSVPVLGGEPQLWLKNASGLTWTGPQQLLFSEIKMGLHMGIVAATENRMGVRDVYLPFGDACMSHRSYLSPNGQSVLVVEMDEDHLWSPCRLVPADGSSTGRLVGPPGGCTFGAWSPDGKWMYFTSNAVGGNHIWRQRFPDGQPEQITSGPTAEQGIAMASDGRSLITAVSLTGTSLQMHDANGDREIVTEGNAAEPKFTPDGTRLCYRMVKEPPSEYNFFREAGELRVMNLKSGRSEPLVRGLEVTDYDISADGREVVMQIADDHGKQRLWLVPFDRSTPPRLIPNAEGNSPRFGRDGEILFRVREGIRNGDSIGSIYRIRHDGSRLMKAFEQPVLFLVSVSPDHQWVFVWAPASGNGSPIFEVLPMDGGNPVVLGTAVRLAWSPVGATIAFYSPFGAIMPANRWYLVPLAHGRSLPPIPAGGFRSEGEIARLPGARSVDNVDGLWPGIENGTYAFYRGAAERNLYRIPIR
jgi:serine/threonine protein kinase/Tol biopolymer transport system component